MARSIADPRHSCRPGNVRGRLLPALTLLAFSLLPVAVAATLSGAIIWEKGENLRFSTRENTWSLEKVRLTHGSDTVVEADVAKGATSPDEADELDLSGNVHIDFRGALLDADSALIRFRGENLLSVRVKGSQTQARFSHQPSGSANRIQGRADMIDYDATSGEVRFSGNTSYTDGIRTFEANVVTYNFNDGSGTASRGSGILNLSKERERIPAPRATDRESAQ